MRRGGEYLFEVLKCLLESFYFNVYNNSMLCFLREASKMTITDDVLVTILCILINKLLIFNYISGLMPIQVSILSYLLR